MRATATDRFSRTPVLRLGLVVLVAMALFLPGWAVYLSVILPHKRVAENWDVAWVGFDLGLALLAALAVVALLRRSDRTPVLAGALAAAHACDAWFDVMTSGDDRVFAVMLALAAELPIAAIAVVVGLRSVRALRQRA